MLNLLICQCPHFHSVTDIYITDVEIQNNVWYACCFAGDTSSLPTSTPGIMASYNNGASWYFLNTGMSNTSS